MHTNARLISSLMLSTALISVSAPAFAVDALETPMGGNVVAGSATIENGAPGQLTVNQSSDRTVIDWDSFNIGRDATTEFVQPGRNALAVNRVTGPGTDPTQVLGTLRANGRVMVLDRNGVVFGKSARVDVGGIVASTGDVNTAQVMSGSDRIELTNTGNGAVENHGDITVAEGGLAALVAPTVRNSGTINARLGRVGLASGDKVTVDLYGDNLIEMEVNGTAQQALIEQAGTIQAEGGVVQISTRTAKDVVDNVINLDGVTSASSVTQQGGRIVLSGGDINVAGTVEASGRTGGTVHVQAEKLAMAGTARVAADSNAGQAAGRIDLLASGQAKFDGTISATGAKGTGFVETSAPEVDFGADTRVMATDQWVIDPTNITIGPVLEFALELQLGLFGNAVVFTPAIGFQPGNITVNNTVNWSTNNSLSLFAHNDILFNAGGGFVNTGAGNISLTAGRNVLVAGNGIHTNGGDITIASQRLRVAANEVNAGGGDILISNTGGFDALANSLRTSGTGTIELNQNKDANAFLSSNSIQNAVSAIDNTGTGANTIHVGAGSWSENVLVDRSVRLLGANAGVGGSAARGPESILNAAGTAFTVTGNSVHINGFRFDGVDVGVFTSGDATNVTHNLFAGTVNSAIVANTAFDLIATNNAILGAGQYGVLLTDSDSAWVVSNTIRNTGNSAVRVQSSDGATVASNTLSNTGNNAIHLSDSRYAFVVGNYVGYLDAGVTSAGAFNIKGDGILVMNSDNDAGNRTYIRGNYVTDTKSIAWDNGSGIQVWGSDFVEVGGPLATDANHVQNTNWDSIRIQSVLDTNITGNVLQNATRTGIYIGSSNRVTAANNQFSGAGSHFGIHVDNSRDTSVLTNTLSNTFQDGIFFEKNTGTNLAAGNLISATGDDGIAAITTSNLTLQGNGISNTTGNGIEVDSLTGATLIQGNTVDGTGSDGIYAIRVNNMSVLGNVIGFGAGSINGDGIFVTKSDNTSVQRTYIRGNQVTNTLSPAWDKGSGIQVTGSDFVEIGGTGLGDANSTSNTAWDGIRIQSVLDTTAINNVMFGSTRTGLYIGSSNRVLAQGNTIVGTTSHFGIHGDNTKDLTATGNIIFNAFQDGIFFEKMTGTNTISSNTVVASGDDGIAADNVSTLFIASNFVSGNAGDGIDANNVKTLDIGGGVLDANTVTGSGANGIRVTNPADGVVRILSNSVSASAVDGISATNVNSLEVADNTVTTAGGAGIHVDGKHYGSASIHGNSVTDATVGMQLESGLIDLTGATNTLTNGDVGLRFVSGNVDLQGDTIGTTTFAGQTTYYVELLSGALFAPGTPTILDGLNASYDGLTPSLTGGVLTALEEAALEGKFWHFNDDPTVGLFFFGSAPLAPAALTFDDEDAFNTFAAFTPAAGRVGLTITGLPRLPGAPQPATTPAAPNDLTNPDVLNTLAPAAGGDQNGTEATPTAEEVAAIAPAAGGGQTATCWSDATSLASAGQAVNFDFPSDADAALAGAAACGSATP